MHGACRRPGSPVGRISRLCRPHAEGKASTIPALYQPGEGRSHNFSGLTRCVRRPSTQPPAALRVRGRNPGAPARHVVKSRGARRSNPVLRARRFVDPDLRRHERARDRGVYAIAWRVDRRDARTLFLRARPRPAARCRFGRCPGYRSPGGDGASPASPDRLHCRRRAWRRRNLKKEAPAPCGNGRSEKSTLEVL